MSGIERIISELQNLGYDPFPVNDTPQGSAVFIRYEVPTGKYRGAKVFLGFSFQEEGYPEYPPHWIHISPSDYNDGLGGASNSYQFKDDQGIERDCITFSRPPNDIWDKLPTKHMRHYLDQHISRFCKGLK